MPVGRIPGPYGKDDFFGCILKPGPLGSTYFKGEFPYLTPGPMGTHKDHAAAVAESTKKTPDVDEEELKLLDAAYGVVKNKTGDRAYVYWKEGKKQYRVKDYAADRNAFFGSSKAYADFRDKAREELDADEGKLRRYIEPSALKRKSVTDWKKAQDIFYAWVRKAYEKELGDKADIPNLIKSQMSEMLKKALQQVKVDYGKSFQMGGFNPRPMKLGGYRLGTLSEHATGMAIDVESAKDATKEQKAAAAKVLADPLGAAARETAELKSIGETFLKQWQNGLFDLPWDLVKELHEEGFLWGATFSHADLHHFEL